MDVKSIGKPLTMDLVFTKTKSDSLHNIKNLNLWGNELEDLRLIEKMPNLQVVSLSVNKISSLKDFAHCNKLQELYLRKNNITDISEIKYLVKLPALKVLWLHDNPCSQVCLSLKQIDNYREIVIKNLPNLVKLDNNPITPEQRQSAQNVKILGSSSRPIQSEYQSQKPRPSYKNQSKWDRPQTNHSNMQNPPHHRNSQHNYPEQQKITTPNDKWQRRVSQGSAHQPSSRERREINFPREEQITRNQNILMAILSLMRELDQGSLQMIRREVDKMLQ